MAVTGSAAPDHLDLPGASPFRPRLRHARLRNLDRTRLAAFTQDGRGTTASAKSPDDGERIGIACDHLVGCESARSAPRRAIDAVTDGDTPVRRARPAFIGALDPLSRMRT